MSYPGCPQACSLSSLNIIEKDVSPACQFSQPEQLSVFHAIPPKGRGHQQVPHSHSRHGASPRETRRKKVRCTGGIYASSICREIPLHDRRATQDKPQACPFSVKAATKQIIHHSQSNSFCGPSKQVPVQGRIQ